MAEIPHMARSVMECPHKPDIMFGADLCGDCHSTAEQIGSIEVTEWTDSVVCVSFNGGRAWVHLCAYHYHLAAGKD